MNNSAQVGSSVVIKGELSAKEDIRIAGRVEGRVDVDGFTLTVEPSAEVDADISASGIIIAGTVKGSIVAEQRIELRSTASVEGDLTAPVVRVDEGAVLRGKVDIEGTRQAATLARAS
jgi:cytoskeletal protein CcmA (bactofilin family)